jgi:hypothetical protein
MRCECIYICMDGKEATVAFQRPTALLLIRQFRYLHSSVVLQSFSLDSWMDNEVVAKRKVSGRAQIWASLWLLHDRAALLENSAS